MDGEKKATAATPEGTCVVCGKAEAPDAPVQWADQTRRLCEGCVDGELARLAEERKAKRAAGKRAGKTKAAKPEAGEAATAETKTETDTNHENKETEMPKTKKTPKTPKAKAEKKPKAPKAPKAPKPERKKLGEVALVMRVSKEALAYIDQQAGDRPRTVFLREILAKGDSKLGKVLEPT